jgi:hypothetical protein
MIRPDAMAAALESDGWQVERGKAFHHASKRIAGIAAPGAFSPDGGRVIRLRVDSAGGLQRMGAWGDIERHVSLFGRHDPAAAIADALTP